VAEQLIDRITVWLFKHGIKGKPCWMCSFYKASHIQPELEFDMESYPCAEYMQLKASFHHD